MPYFVYNGLDASGKRVNGFAFADGVADLELQLKNINVQLQTATEKTKSALDNFKDKLLGHRLSSKEMIYFFSYIQQLTKSGLTLNQALYNMYEETRYAKLKEIAYKFYISIDSGNTLSDTIALYEGYFNKVFVGLVQVGEESNNLNESFDYIINYIKVNSSLTRKVKFSLIYPIFLIIMCVGMIIGSGVLIIPKFKDLFGQDESNLPFQTIMLLETSRFLSAYYVYILGFLVFLAISIILLVRNSSLFRLKLDKILLKLPVFGELIKKTEITRFAIFYSTMYVSNQNAVVSLQEAIKAVNNSAFRGELNNVVNQIINGESLTNAFMSMPSLPRFSLRMFRIADDSGNIMEAMSNIVFFYTQEIENTTNSMINMIKPTLLITVGLIMIWIIAGIFLPLYSRIGNIQNFM